MSWNSGVINGPTVASAYQNGLDVMDFGDYTGYAANPDGHGCALTFPASIASTGGSANIHNFFAVWGDYAEAKNCTSNGVNKTGGKPLRGPSVYGAGSGYGYRGFGGDGKGYPLLAASPCGGYYGADFIRVDGDNSYSFTTSAETKKQPVPPDGMHVLDWKIGSTGSPIDYVGGCRWASAWDGGSGSNNTGAWGGVRIGEMLIYRQMVSETFRTCIAAALGQKWFNRTNVWSYASVRIDDGAKLSLSGAALAVKDLTLGGTVTAASVTATNLTVTAASSVSGDLALRGASTMSVSFVAGEPATVSADAFSLDSCERSRSLNTAARR